MACGVLGEGLYTSSPYPFESVFGYGVFGRVGTLKGAGVYGTINPKDRGSATNGLYAGYFNDPVNVVGDLTVTGAVNGVILVPEASSSVSDITEHQITNSISSKIKDLKLNSYLLETRSNSTYSLTKNNSLFCEWHSNQK